MTNPLFLSWVADCAAVWLAVTLAVVMAGLVIGGALAHVQQDPRRLDTFGSPFLAVCGLLVPGAVAAIRLQLIGAFTTLLTLLVATALVFAIWQFRVGFTRISSSLLDAARTEGGSSVKLFRLVALPAMGSALIPALSFSAMIAWTLFVIAPFLFPELRPGFLPPLPSRVGLVEVAVLSAPLIVFFLLLLCAHGARPMPNE